MPATTATRSSRRSSARRPSSTTRRPSSSRIRRRSSWRAAIAALAPGDLDHVFFCNSGSEAVDTALKIALAFHNVRGNASRVRLIGRERGYHGVGFGGIAVGGIVNNRKLFGALLAGVDHLPHTYNRDEQAFSIGEPEWGAHLADELDRLVALHDASTIAAVIVEPMAGSTGVLPPPKGYLQRLRAICDKHGILLDLRRGHHRLRPPRPRLRRRALRRRARHDHLRQGHHLGQRADGRRARAQGHLRRLHARARSTSSNCSTATPIRRIRSPARPASPRSISIATRTCSSARASSSRCGRRRRWALKGLPNVLDIRTVGLTVGIDLASRPDAVGKRGFEAMERGFHEQDLMFRARRRHARADAAADRERSADRRDLRQGRQDHQGGGVSVPVAPHCGATVEERLRVRQLSGSARGSQDDSQPCGTSIRRRADKLPHRNSEVLIVCVVLLLAAAAGWWRFGRGPQVASVAAARGTAVEIVYATGGVEPVRWAKVASVDPRPHRRDLRLRGQDRRQGRRAGAARRPRGAGAD